MNLSRVGHYRVEERIGAGGMGQVYRAYDERLDRWVAVKIIAPDLRKDEIQRERLRREARASARLTHPAIVKIFDLLLTDEADAIVMELVEGVSLAQILRDGPLDLPRAFSVGREIADALTEAHSHSIVHRDLKTENVVFTPAGHPKILDFGIAKLLDQSGASLTLDGRVLGTCRAMAPEQAEGREIDHRADLFALGNLLYEVLTGQSPFLDRNAAATLRKVCTHRQPPVRSLNPWIPAELSNLIDQLLEKEPASRPRSAREVAMRLARIAAEVQLSFSGDTVSGTYSGEATLVELPASPVPPHPLPAHLLPANLHAAAPPPALAAAERRQVTVLLCGPVHPGGEPLDPEEMLDGMRELHNAMAEIVERFDGHLGPARDFGWLAWFGYPRAREDDACQAVRAALHIVEQARAICPTTGRDLARLRAGIHTGPMIMAREPAQFGDALALGETPTVAALIQSLAGPGAVLVSQVTHRLIEGFFDCEELGLSLPTGSSRPAPVYRIQEDRGVHSRFAAAGRRTPLVARERELGLLLEHWEHAREGHGQLVLLSGEAGIGKSRLVWELRHRINAGSVEWLEGSATADQRHSPLHPFVPILHQLLGTGGEGTRGERLRRLEEALARQASLVPEPSSDQTPDRVPDHQPLLAQLLALSDTEPPTASTVSPAVQRQRILECVVSVLLAAAERRPLLISIEDLHWADLSTRELLDLLIQHLAGSSIFLLLTTRPEPEPPPLPSFGTHLTLAPLTRAQARCLIETLGAKRAEGREIEPEQTEQILARADGVPLFVEELTRAALENGPSAEIPATLEGWLQARLDRLGPARELAQVASAIGRELSWTLLRGVSHWDDATLKARLDHLVDAEILHRRGLHPASRFRFRHALLQEAAYSSLLRSDRQKLHRRIARVLESSPDAENQPEVVAHHFTEAGQPEEAVVWWQRAGERAGRAAAWREALGHLARAMTSLRALPERPEGDFLEIALQAQLGDATALVSSPSTPEAGAAYTRAWELCQRLGEAAPRRFDVLRGLCFHSLISGEEEAATLAAGRLLDRVHQQAHPHGDPALLTTGHQAMGFARLLGGDLAQAQAHLEEALDASASPADPAALAALSNLSWVLWLLGHPDQALRRAREAAELARTLAAPSLPRAFVELSVAELHAFRREPEEVRRHAEILLPLATEQGFQLFAALGRFQLGWAREAQGDGDEAMAAMRASLAARRALRAYAFLPNHKALLADAYLRADRVVEGLATLKEALALQGDQRMLEAELHRLKGELLRRHGQSDAEVEDHLQRSLEVARRQGARSLELRAALSHAYLRAHQERRPEGHDLLASVYETFTEGLDTPDLREARAMLEEME